MPSMSPVPPPDDPTPLSAREQRVLDELERDLGDVDQPQADGPDAARPPPRHLDAAARSVAVIVVLLVVLPGQWRAAVTLFAVLAGAVALGLWLDRLVTSWPDEDSRD